MHYCRDITKVFTKIWAKDSLVNGRTENLKKVPWFFDIDTPFAIFPWDEKFTNFYFLYPRYGFVYFSRFFLKLFRGVTNYTIRWYCKDCFFRGLEVF